MTSCLRFLGLFAMLFLTLVFAQREQTSGESATVTGRVLDAQGQPVSDARISVFPSGAGSGGLPYATTSKDGSYRLVSPPYGETWLCAVKESAGYPDTNALLFAPDVDRRPKVFLAPGSHLELDIHLEPPNGTLEGYVTDATTKAVIKNGRVVMRREKPESMYSATITPDGHFLFALPPAPIEISVTAPGHLQWKYRDAESRADKLVLSRSEHRVIKIELTPEKQPSF